MKKLIPAICMLLVAATLMGTSTYAWFSMNTNVTASGMSVTANTDNAFLIIKAGTELSGNKTSEELTVSAALRPVKPMGTLTSTNVETVTAWGYATSTNPDDANTGASLTALSSDTTLLGTGNYVLKQSFKVGIVQNSGTVAHPLTLQSVTITPSAGGKLADGLTVVFVCGSNIYSYNSTSADLALKLAESTDVTTSGVTVDVYFYIDGSNAEVKTTNAANLSGTVSFTFSIENEASNN